MGMVVWGGVRTVVLLVRLVGLANSRQFGAVLRCGRILVQIQFEADVLNLRLLAMGTKRSENAKLLGTLFTNVTTPNGLVRFP